MSSIALPNNVDAVLARVDELSPSLEWIANRYAFGTGKDPEDLRQEFFLTFLDCQENNPEFLQQSKAYLLTRAKWAALRAIEDEETYRRHIGSVCFEDREDIPDVNMPNPEDVIIERESFQETVTRITALSKENQAVIIMVFFGYSTNEIADYLKISPPAVSQRKAVIRQAISGRK